MVAIGVAIGFEQVLRAVSDFHTPLVGEVGQVNGGLPTPFFIDDDYTCDEEDSSSLYVSAPIFAFPPSPFPPPNSSGRFPGSFSGQNLGCIKMA